MKQKISKTASVMVCLALVLSLAILPLGHTFGAGAQESQSNISPKQKQAIAAFEARVKEYAKLREGLEEKLPKLSKDSTPEQIETHKAAFEELVRAARTGTKPGNAFTPEISDYIRMTIRDEFKGKERVELRKMVMEADTKGVPLKVNYPYPENKELVEIPATLLLRLPQLPKQVKYRFVNRHMLLVDRENGLIIDYMLDALP